MLPAIFGSSVAQINVLLSGIIASLLPVGSISFLYYSDRLMEFPLGLFGIALATVTLPYLSRLWVNDDRESFSRTLDWSMRLALLIALPASLALVLLAEPLVATLFYGGEFDERSVRMTVMALRAYAVGLLGFSFVKVLVPAFFAREDTRTPVRIGLVALATNLVVGVSLAGYLSFNEFAGPHVGLAFATSLAAILNAALLYRSLREASVLQHAPGWPALLSRVLVANTVMCIVLLQLARPLAWWIASTTLERGLWIAVLVGAGAGSYFLTLIIVGARSAQFRLKSD
jgi:putative peptidoglycan lipid II flippase